MILDATAGYRMMWANKNDSDTIYLDSRKEVKPNLVALWQFLPFQNDFFDLILFDPPHDKPGPRGIFRQKFGALNLDTFHIDFWQAWRELFRVLKPNHFLIFKWCETRRKLHTVISLCPYKPLFYNLFKGSKSSNETMTFWVVFRKG